MVNIGHETASGIATALGAFATLLATATRNRKLPNVTIDRSAQDHGMTPPTTMGRKITL